MWKVGIIEELLQVKNGQIRAAHFKVAENRKNEGHYH